jgi:hypothetical protein
MDRCELHTSCFFFNEQVSNMPQFLGPLRDNYCDGNFVNCARFKISQALGRDKVPTFMYPNGFFETRIHAESKFQKY